MSAPEKPEAWYEGHKVGYDAAEDDLTELVAETITEWHELKLVTDIQMLALKDLSHFLELRRARR